MAVRASKPRYVHSSAVSRCEGETSFNQIQVGGQGGRSEASRWGKPSVCAWTREGQDAFLAIFDRVTGPGSKPERLRSGFLQADLSLIV